MDTNENVMKFKLSNRSLAERLLTRRRVLTTGVAASAAMGAQALLVNAGSAVAQVAQPAPRDSTTRPADKAFDFEQTNPSRDNSPRPQSPLPPGEPGKDYTPCVVPNGWTLPYTIVDGVKVFHLVAEEVYHEFAPGLRAHCWGYNGSVHGPLIEAVEGDRVRIFVTNKIAPPTTVHWHGVLLPSGMDGVGGLSQPIIHTGQTFMYEFTLNQHGTLMYHSHHDEMTQMGMGMTGMIVIHPRNPKGPRADRDFVLMLHEWAIEVGVERPDPNEMTDFNVLTINGKAFPGTAPLVVRLNDKVRIRIGNLSAMDHHPIHLHGYYFKVTETDGGQIPEAGQWPETTVLVSVGSTRTIDFVADNPGDWAMHCHMTHHVMNQMGHEFPNMIGVNPEGLDEKVRNLLPNYMTMGQEGMGDMAEMGMAMPHNSIPMVGGHGPYDYITMGGMFTILKVRENLPNGYDGEVGWYNPPPGTLASLAPPAVLEANGVNPDAYPLPPRGVPVPPTRGQAAEGEQVEGLASPLAPQGAGALYVCPMHPEVTSNQPNQRCPECNMKLVPKK